MNKLARRFLAAFALLAALPAAGAISLASLRSDGTPPVDFSDGSYAPAVTPDGRYVAFVASSSNLVTPGATGFQVYLRDRVLGTTELVSVSTGGTGGNSSSSSPTLSSDGCRVAFISFASDLVAGDINGTQDLFVRNRCGANTTTLASSSSAGALYGNGQTFSARMSGAGNKVAFTSYSTNLVPGLQGAGNGCLYVKDLGTGATTAPTANGQCIAASSPDLSFDGSRMVFWAYTQPGTAFLLNDVWQIWLWDFAAAPGSELSLVSKSANGSAQYRTDPSNPNRSGEGASTVTEPAISPDGDYVAFRSRAWGLDAQDGGGISHIFIKELSTGTIVKASVSSAGALANDDSGGTGAGERPGLSRYANVITFRTNATNLAPETAGVVPNVVARNPYTGVTRGYASTPQLSGQPALNDYGSVIVAYSGGNLDPAFASRGVFVVDALLTPAADLSLALNVPGFPWKAGRDVTYNFTTSNAGPEAAPDATLSVTLYIAGGQFVWASPGCTHASGIVTCALGTIAAGTSKATKVVVRPGAAGSGFGMEGEVGALVAEPVSNNTANTFLVIQASPAAQAVQRYRLFSPVTNEHLYTTDLNEYNVLGSFVGTWVKEGPVGKVFDNPGSFNGVAATPYYRLYNTSNAQHHWTTDPNEYYFLGLFPQYNSEGVDGFIFPTQAAGTIPLYRLLYPFSVPVSGLHHWTIDAVEYGQLIAVFGWIGEGGSGFVIP